MTNNYSHDPKRRFGGVERLYGRKALSHFKNAHIVVIGIGGVGSWAVEALARNAVGKLTLIDMDVVAESNINRQLPALSSTLGKNKIDVMAERIHDINPDCDVSLVDDFITQSNLMTLLDEEINHKIDFIVDCIDSSRVKSALIAWCKRRKIKIITLGGAGGQTDPRLITLSDLSKTKHDPLLSKTRKLLRQDFNFSSNPKRRFNIPCVYSSEQLKHATLNGNVVNNKPAPNDGVTNSLSCAGGIGSSIMVTGSFAFIAISYVLEKIANKE